MNNKKNIVGGLFWSFAERICAQLVSIIVGIILARILIPEDYGVISIVMVFITLCDIFVESGFGSALVQKREVDEVDFNTAFFMSFILALLLYIIVFFISPSIAKFYDKEILTNVLRVLGLRLLITSLNTIQQAHIRREMLFKKFFLATIIGTIVSCIVGVVMAYMGFGVWSLVAQYLVNSFIDTIILSIVGGWNPRLQFSKKKAKDLYSFGIKVLFTNLIASIENSLRTLIIGKRFSSEDLAYYDQGQKYPALLVNNINSTIQKVMLPAFSRVQDEKEELKNILRKSVKLETFIVAPILIGFAAVADNFVLVILTDKWLAAIPFIQLLSISYLTRPIESSCHQSLLAIGKSGLVFWMMSFINIVGIVSTLIAVFLLNKVIYIAIFSLIISVVSACCFLISTQINLKYKSIEQISDIFPAIGLSLFMGGVVYLMNYFSILPTSLCLVLQILVGVIIYISGAFIFKMEAFRMILQYIRKIKKRKVEDVNT